MQIQTFLLNRTYIAQDRTTGLTVSADTQQQAEAKLLSLVNEYWEKKKVIVPITMDGDGTDQKIKKQ